MAAKTFVGYGDAFRHPVTGEFLWKYGTRIWFPNVQMKIVQGKRHQKSVGFKTDQKITKFEIRQFLTKVYGLNVKKVCTLNYEPKYGHAASWGNKKSIKMRSSFKKAYATLSDTPVKSVVDKMDRHAQEIRTVCEHARKEVEAKTENKATKQKTNKKQKKDNLEAPEAGQKE